MASLNLASNRDILVWVFAGSGLKNLSHPALVVGIDAGGTEGGAFAIAR